ncbi:unnamed protein product [Rotaria magnacalcarata]|uniref:Uncharacterized protein n=2 Tax=Rotaria magnacalcarata TaxID=392030 RepID=A0A819ML19_9BILA|nr:unnamed protein product [Rotaria magnacalcarata]CAF3980908.1 unnamed protein product [Rotaria magnacalcarata]
MPYFVVAHRRNLVQSSSPNCHIIPRNQMTRQPSSAPRNDIPRRLPVLQAPTFPRLSKYYHEETQYQTAEEEEELYQYPIYYSSTWSPYQGISNATANYH